MKIKSLSKFTRKTGITCFFLPSVPKSVGLNVSGINKPSVELLTLSATPFTTSIVETENSEEGREKVLNELNEVTTKDGGFFAPLYSKICKSGDEFIYEVRGDVTLSNYFGDSFLHVGNGKAKLHILNTEDGKLINKLKLPSGVRIFVSHQDVPFKVTHSDDRKVWNIVPLSNVPLVDMSEIYINRNTGVTARIKEKNWTPLSEGSFIAVNKTKVNFYTGDKKHSQYVSAGTVFHVDSNVRREGNKLFTDVSEGHVCLTKDYVKVDYLIETNLVSQINKANNPKPKKSKSEKKNKKHDKRKDRKTDKKSKKHSHTEASA